MMPPSDISLTLEDKTPDEREAFVERTLAEYRQDLLVSGLSSKEADENIARHRGLFDDQFFLNVMREGEKVGTLWLGLRNGVGPDWWIFDIVIDEPHRGTGLGRPTLRAAEEFVQSHGGTRLGLNVFGHNEVARHLYDAAGYVVGTQQMYKDLS
ncbi:MAG TPA: GNAT family N-acetyltransferase [Acidimicrobiales bacterium]|nr:GNAT family N-acetyltransferase [Acidimicrobiales bacterium]